MNKEDIIRMANEAGIIHPEMVYQTLERFAALVAKHTLLNLDPNSFMSWQEGFEAGKQTEREACAKVCEDAPEPDGADLAERIRARGQE